MFPEREEKVGKLNLNTHRNIMTIIKSKYKMLEKKISLAEVKHNKRQLHWSC